MPKKVLCRTSPETVRVTEQIRRVELLRTRHAAAIIAAGVFSHAPDVLEEVLYGLCEEATKTDRARFDALFDGLEQAREGSTTMPRPTPDDPDAFDLAANQLVTLATEWADQGFVLGLAVGMQLGPSAFGTSDAAATKKGGRR